MAAKRSNALPGFEGVVELVDVDTVARWLGLEIRRVQQLAKEGTLPKAARGKYNLEKCVAGYVAYLRGGGKPAQVIDFAAERARLTKLRADTLDAELETLLQTLVPSEIVVEILGVVVHNIRGKLLSFPGRYSPRLAKRTSNQVKGILRAAVLEVCNELSTGDEILAEARRSSSSG